MAQSAALFGAREKNYLGKKFYLGSYFGARGLCSIYHGFRDINDYLAIYANFRKFLPLVTSGELNPPAELNVDLGKKSPK